MTDGSSERPPIRVLLAVGNPERERRLRDALSNDGLVVAGRCLDGPSLVEQAARGDVDAALASSDLHRLSAATLTALHQARLPVVLLAESVEIEKYRGLAHLLPAASADADVATALRQALARGPNYGPSPEAGRSEGSGGGVAESENPGGRVIAVVSGKGAPGVTTLAIGLAAALANRGRRVVLVDADLRGGNVVGYLDLDPRRGMLGLTFGGNGASEEARLEEELQEGPGFMVLAGIERPDSRHNVSPELATAAVTTLRSLFEDIVVDVGEVIGAVSSSTTDAVLRSADRVLLVAGADLVALWNARSAVRHVREGLGIAEEADGCRPEPKRRAPALRAGGGRARAGPAGARRRARGSALGEARHRAATAHYGCERPGGAGAESPRFAADRRNACRRAQAEETVAAAFETERRGENVMVSPIAIQESRAGAARRGARGAAARRRRGRAGRAWPRRGRAGAAGHRRPHRRLQPTGGVGG